MTKTKKTLFLFSFLLLLFKTTPSHSHILNNYYLIHNAQEYASHFLTHITSQGDLIQIEDGSYWDIPSSDRHVLYNWRAGDVLLITPNPFFFSFYTYAIQNTSTGTFILANLSIGPIANGVYTHWITGLNQTSGQIVLENGSLWKVCGSDWDMNQFNKWVVGDTLIIGSNDKPYSSYDNILINVNLNHYVRARMY